MLMLWYQWIINLMKQASKVLREVARQESSIAVLPWKAVLFFFKERIKILNFLRCECSFE